MMENYISRTVLENRQHALERQLDKIKRVIADIESTLKTLEFDKTLLRDQLGSTNDQERTDTIAKIKQIDRQIDELEPTLNMLHWHYDRLVKLSASITAKLVFIPEPE